MTPSVLFLMHILFCFNLCICCCFYFVSSEEGIDGSHCLCWIEINIRMKQHTIISDKILINLIIIIKYKISHITLKAASPEYGHSLRLSPYFIPCCETCCFCQFNGTLYIVWRLLFDWPSYIQIINLYHQYKKKLLSINKQRVHVCVIKSASIFYLKSITVCSF